MIYSIVKLVVVGVLAVVLIIGMLLGLDPTWAVPALTALIGYAVGNTRLTDSRPIVESV